MSIIDRIRNLKKEIDAKADEITTQQEKKDREIGIKHSKVKLLEKLNKSPDGKYDNTWGFMYAQVRENGEVKGYEIYKSYLDANYDKKYKKIEKDNGDGLFSLDEAAEHCYNAEQEGGDYLWHSQMLHEKHKEGVKKNRGQARKMVLAKKFNELKNR